MFQEIQCRVNIHLAKTTAVQNEVMLTYHWARALCFWTVVFMPIIVTDLLQIASVLSTITAFANQNSI